MKTNSRTTAGQAKDISQAPTPEVTPMLPTKFRVNCTFGSGEEAKDFQDGRHGGHLGYLIGTILVILYLQILKLPTKF